MMGWKLRGKIVKYILLKLEMNEKGGDNIKTFLKILICIIVVLIIYMIMFYNTNSVLSMIKEAFYCRDFYIDEESYDPEIYNVEDINYVLYKNDDYNKNIFAHFNSMRRYSIDEYTNATIELEVYRTFVLHNFFNGYVWIQYTLEVLDENGNHIAGSARIPVKMKINKKKGEWEVVQIWEAP